jgi:hypothetical protein
MDFAFVAIKEEESAHAVQKISGEQTGLNRLL